MDHAISALEGLWSLFDLSTETLGHIELSGPEETLPSVFRVGTAAIASSGAATLAVRDLLKLSREVGHASVDGRHASAAFRSERYLTVDGVAPPTPWSPLSGHYKTSNGGWIQLHCNFDHHRDGVLAELETRDDRDSVASTIAKRDRIELEDALASRAMCATAFRSIEEWHSHPQGIAVSRLPVLEVVKIGEAPVEPLRGDQGRALDSLRVLDLTRIIAGPVCGRFLAAHGASVMRVGARHLPVIGSIVADTGMGKLATDTDLRTESGTTTFMALARDADVVVEGYRPGGIRSLGLGPEQLAAARPGLVYASLSAYSHVGPWSGRRGFDSLVQTASGIAWAGMQAAGAKGPRPLPAQALDHASGYLLAFGIAVALRRRATIGGSWLVRASLAQTGSWLVGLGTHNGLDLPEPEPPADLMTYYDSDHGRIGVVKPVGSIAGAEPRWDRPAPVLGSSPPQWSS